MEVYIVLTDTGTWFTRMIRLFTKKPLNHTSLSFEKDLHTVYSFGRKRPKNPFVGGFVKEDMKGTLFARATCAIYSLSITESQMIKMKQFLLEVEKEQKKYRYNLLGLIGVLFHKEINRKYAFFCSEFVAITLNKGGILVKDKSVHLIRPFDFAECEDFQLVYAGPLHIYLSQEESNLIPMTG